MLIAIAALALLFASFDYLGTFGVAVSLLALGAILGGIGRRYEGFRNLRRCRLLLIPGAVLFGFCVIGWGLLGYGPSLTTAFWPRGLHQMADACNAGSVQVYGLGGFLDTEHVWRMDVESESQRILTREFEMRLMDRRHVPRAFGKAFPGWLRPSPDADCVYFSTADFPVHSRGPDGSHFMAMLDTRSNRLYVWHKSNF